MNKLLLFLFLLPIISFAQPANYTVLLNGKAYLVKGRTIYQTTGSQLKRLDHIRLAGVKKDEWKNTNFGPLLQIARDAKSTATISATQDFLMLAINDDDNKLQDVFYFSRTQDVNLPGQSVNKYYEDLLSTCLASPSKFRYNYGDALNVDHPSVDSTNKQLLERLKQIQIILLKDVHAQALKVNPALGNDTHIVLWRCDHYHDPQNPSVTKLVDLNREDNYYFELLYKYRLDVFHSCIIDLPEPPKDTEWKPADMNIAGISNFKVKTDSIDQASFHKFLERLMLNDFENDTISIREFGNYQVGITSSSVYITDPYSGTFIQLGRDITKVVKHKSFPVFLASITEHDMTSIASPLRSAKRIDDQSFYLKFEKEDYYRVITGDKAYRIRNFEAITNKQQTLRLLKDKVGSDQVVEVKAVDDLLFLLTGDLLYTMTDTDLKFITSGVSNLEQALMPSNMAIFIFQDSKPDTINLLKLDKSTLEVAIIANGLRKLLCPELMKLFLQRIETDTSLRHLARWELSADQRHLAGEFSESSLICSYIDSNLFYKKYSMPPPLPQAFTAPWFSVFQQYDNIKPMWEIHEVEGAGPFFYGDGVLYYYSGSSIVRYDSINIPELIRNKNFLKELNKEAAFDTLFINRPVYASREIADNKLGVVKYKGEDFYRLYPLHDAPYVPVKIKKFTEIQNDGQLIQNLIETIRVNNIADTIQYSKQGSYQFIRSASRLWYYEPQNDILHAVATSRPQMGNDAEFLIQSVMQKVAYQTVYDSHKPYNLKVETTYSFDTTFTNNPDRRYDYTLYKFAEEEFYRGQLKTTFKNVTDSAHFYFKVYPKNIGSIFEDRSYLSEYLSLYKGADYADIKSVAIGKNASSGHIVYTQSGFEILSKKSRSTFSYYFACNALREFYDGAFLHKNLHPEFIRLTRSLAKTERSTSNYHIIGLSKHAIIFTSDADVQCLEDLCDQAVPGKQVFVFHKGKRSTINLSRNTYAAFERLLDEGVYSLVE